MIVQDDSSNPESLPVVDSVLRFFHTMPLKIRGNYFFTAKKFEKESPWLVNVIGGELHLDKAWAERGGGWGYNVSDSDWEGFAEHLKRAENCFKRAWKICPERPHAATGMITVSMGASENPHEAMQEWFQRAIDAQLDYSSAYHRMFSGLRPRWHGTHEQMLQLGRLAASTERFDTDVPYMLCESLWRILHDFQNDEGDGFLRENEVFDEVESVCRKYIDQYQQQDCESPWWHTVLAGFAFLDERYELAKDQINELDGELNEETLSRFPLSHDAVISKVFRNVGPKRDAIAAIDEATQKTDYGNAMVLIESLLKQDGLRPQVTSSLRSDLQAAKWLIQFASGEEVSLLPEKDLAGWSVLSGKWISRHTGALRGESGESNRNGLVTICQADFGQRWVLTGEIARGGGRASHGMAGVYLYEGRDRKYSFVYNHASQWMSYGPIGELSTNERRFVPKSIVVPFEIRFDQGEINVWLDYRELVKKYKLAGYDPEAELTIAIGTVIEHDGTVLTYRNLKVKRLADDQK